MTIKRKDFQKAAAFIHEFLLKLGPDTECAELRDSLNLSLLHMQRHYRALRSKVRGLNEIIMPSRLTQSLRGLSPMTPFKDSPDKFQWRWIELDQVVKRKPSESLSSTLSLIGGETGAGQQRMKTFDVPVVLRITKHGEDNRLLKLIDSEPKCLKERDQLGRTALMYAVHYGHLDTVQHILEQSVDIDATAVDGSSAVHRACYNGNSEALRLLVEYGCSCDLQDGQGRAPVHWACSTEDNDCLKILLEREVNTRCRDLEGLTPAMWACRQDHHAHFTMVNQYDFTQLGDECSRDNNGRTWLHWSVRRKEPLQCLKSLLSLESALMRDDEGKSVVHTATEQGSIASLKAIVEVAGIECLQQRDKENRTPLHLATICGHGELVNYLLSVKVDLAVVDDWMQTAWDYARTRQLHYCMLIIASYIRQQNRSSGYDLDKLQIENKNKDMIGYPDNTDLDFIADSHHIPKPPPQSLPLEPGGYPKSPTRPSPLGQQARFMPTPPPPAQEDLGIPLTPRGPPLSSRALDKGLNRGYAIKRSPTSPDDAPPLHRGAVQSPPPSLLGHASLHQQQQQQRPVNQSSSTSVDMHRSTSKGSAGSKRLKSNDHESTEIAASLTSLEQSVHEPAPATLLTNEAITTNPFFVVSEGDLNSISVDGMDVSDFEDVNAASLLSPRSDGGKASSLEALSPRHKSKNTPLHLAPTSPHRSVLTLDPVRPLTPNREASISPLPGVNYHHHHHHMDLSKSMKSEELTMPTSTSPTYFNAHAALSPIQGEYKKKKKKKPSHLAELSPMINTPPLNTAPSLTSPTSLVSPLTPPTFDDIPVPQKRTQLTTDKEGMSSSLQPRPRRKQQQTSLHFNEDSSEKFIKSIVQPVTPLAPPLQQAPPPHPQAQPRQKRSSNGKKAGRSREKSKSSRSALSRSEDLNRKSSALASSSVDKLMSSSLMSSSILCDDKMNKSLNSRVKGVTWAPPTSSRL